MPCPESTWWWCVCVCYQAFAAEAKWQLYSQVLNRPYLLNPKAPTLALQLQPSTLNQPYFLNPNPNPINQTLLPNPQPLNSNPSTSHSLDAGSAATR